jgi:hypothetical protein
MDIDEISLAHALSVMAGLDPAIHVFIGQAKASAWMPGSSPGMTVFGA